MRLLLLHATRPYTTRHESPANPHPPAPPPLRLRAPPDAAVTRRRKRGGDMHVLQGMPDARELPAAIQLPLRLRLHRRRLRRHLPHAVERGMDRAGILRSRRRLRLPRVCGPRFEELPLRRWRMCGGHGKSMTAGEMVPALLRGDQLCLQSSALRQHFLNFFPLPQGQGSFLPVSLRMGPWRCVIVC